MLTNILKISFLGLLGFSLLVYFTANKPQKIVDNDHIKTDITLTLIPENLELVGSDKYHKRDEVFKKEAKTLLLVGNHDSLSVVKEFKNYFNTNIEVVTVANISSAPWFVKKMFIPSKLKELNENSKTPMIYDIDGEVVAALNLQDNIKTHYFAYLINENGMISKIYTGSVKEGAMDGTMNDSEKKASLKPILEFL